MKHPVKVTADKEGRVIIPTKNKEFGYVRVSQTNITIKENGWAGQEKTSALIHGSILDLEAMSLKENQELPGQIVVKESLTPFRDPESEKDLKTTGEGGIKCTLKGAPIYRKCFYTEDLTVQDTRIEHDNILEIKNFFQQLKEKTPNLSE